MIRRLFIDFRVEVKMCLKSSRTIHQGRLHPSQSDSSTRRPPILQSAAQGRAPGWRPCDGACELCCGSGWMKAGGVPHCFWQWKAGVVHRKSSSSCAWAQQRGNAAVALCVRVKKLGLEEGSAVVFYVLDCNCSSCFHCYHCLCLHLITWTNLMNSWKYDMKIHMTMSPTPT